MKRDMKASVRRMFGRRFRAGGYSAVAAAAVIAIAVVVNLAAGSLPTSMTQLDLTSQKLYSLSAQTRQIASSLDKDVSLYLLATSGNEDDTITKLLDRYAALNSRIKVSAVDPTQDPSFLKKYELDKGSLFANSVLAECGGRHRLVGYNEIYVTDYVEDSTSYYGYSEKTSFDGENALTNAIHYVSREDLPKVYTLAGHGEAALSENITDAMKRDNMETASLSLLTMDAVPEDADAVIIHVPEKDLSAEEAGMLTAWLEKGGRVALVTGYIEPGKMPNLQKVTAYMGLAAGNGLIVEGDNARHVSRYPWYLLPELQAHEITNPLIEGKYYLLLPQAQPIVETEGTAATVTWLAATSGKAYAKAAGTAMTTTEKAEGDTDGPFHPAAVSELGEGRLFWAASPDLLDDNTDMLVSGANGNLFLNALGWMSGQAESISIRSKSLEVESLTVSAAESTLWSFVFIGLVPLGFVAAGTIVWVRRKRR